MQKKRHVSSFLHTLLHGKTRSGGSNRGKLTTSNRHVFFDFVAAVCNTIFWKEIRHFSKYLYQNNLLKLESVFSYNCNHAINSLQIKLIFFYIFVTDHSSPEIRCSLIYCNRTIRQNTGVLIYLYPNNQSKINNLLEEI